MRLLVCGRKDERHETPGWEVLAQRHGLAGRVHYLGFIDDVRPAIVAADVVAIATRSTLREGLAQSAIDAMACGTPIAAYALEGITDVVGDAAILARPDDVEELSGALIRVLGDPELGAHIAQGGLSRARELFHPGRMADRYESSSRRWFPIAGPGARNTMSPPPRFHVTSVVIAVPSAYSPRLLPRAQNVRRRLRKAAVTAQS